jgi:hypothetical protein
MTHVMQKRAKVRDPFWVDGNTSPAVVFECRIVGIEAAPLHAFPHRVFRCMTTAVLGDSCQMEFRSQATTGLGVSLLDISVAAYQCLATIAQGFDRAWLALGRVLDRENNEAAESVSCYVLQTPLILSDGAV